MKNQLHRIDLEMFEGPLDLLLFLIKRDELNIYDIPIAQITKDFLEYVDLAKELKLHSAGDFVLMAATLMKIKARMLLPIEANGDEEIEDPRTELMNMLLEYKRYKEATATFSEMERFERPHYYNIPATWSPQQEDNTAILEDVKLYDIMLTFQYLIKNYEEPVTHSVAVEEVTLSEQIGFLNGLLQANAKLSFAGLLEKFESRLVVVVTFLAILEMLRNRQVKVKQSKLFDDLLISRGKTFGN
ncbi:MAG: segregation/condensation protein A [Candidatus Marinimicrobia bacterium]|jgi:segregation and condensation protein A|nr:segregation/condensation protein A [Candidatus Neomarinimicrobiota bacterium]MBT3631445.1 segregation/condensation protein A [Candidatus Neomarinimicrobiota bacterium]MBT3825444.1 segregation/condensation protein A [Candidatus Neomarinimicrobiota bacterium]MBT4131545.1 segregation/condensation protein A [Candidatus Neomarinimicrobiota bacterium]MBT4294872.1 segregation/condensation protein A [Candidatus Neomarinimicrobiota bacterium]